MAGNPGLNGVTSRENGMVEAIDQVLDGLRLQSSVFSRMELADGWGFAKDALGGAPFHLVIEGEAWVGHDRTDLTRLAAGEMAVIPGGEAHLLLSSPDAEALGFHRLAARMGLPEWEPGLVIKPTVLRFGPNGPVRARLISGIFEFASSKRNPLLSALPPVLILRGSEDEQLRATVRMIAMTINSEIERAEPGARLVINRLADYLFIQAVREYLCKVNGSGSHPDAGWLLGLGDPLVGAALALMHAHPGRNWSVDKLAQDIGASRSNFARQFRNLVGRGPIDYLRNWRMYMADRQLRETRMSIKEIAEAAGYRSVSAFGKAFSMWAGETPATARRAGTAGSGFNNR